MCHANFGQLHRPRTKPHTSSSKLKNQNHHPKPVPPRLYPLKIHPYMHIIVCQKRKSAELPWKISGFAGFVHVQVPRVTRVYKRRQHRYWHFVLWRCTETFMYLIFLLEEFLTVAFSKYAFAKIQRERTKTFQIKQKWVLSCINPVGMCLHKWTNV